MTKLTQREQDRAEAIAQLRERLTIGSTVYTSLVHVSRSGMTRAIRCYVAKGDQIVEITSTVAAATGFAFDRNRWALKVGGAGMDMGFHVVYSLSRALYPDGHPCTGSDGDSTPSRISRAPRCPSNDHSNDWGDLARQYDREHEAASHTYWEDALMENTAEARSAYVAGRAEWIEAQRPGLYSRKRIHADGGYALKQAWL